MAEMTKYTKPTDDRILTDRAEVNKTVNDTLINLGGLGDGTLAKVDALPNSVIIRDAYGRAKGTHAITGKTDSENNTNDFLVNVGLLNEQLKALKINLSELYYTKEETAAEIQKLLDELIAELGNLDIGYILESVKMISDHIAVTERPHGATSILFPSSIPYRDGYGQFEVGEPQKDSHVARYDTIKKHLDGIDLEYLRGIKEELGKIEDILINSLILWETVELDTVEQVQ